MALMTVLPVVRSAYCIDTAQAPQPPSPQATLVPFQRVRVRK